MARFVALLRGINVAGHQPVKMAALRAVFAGLGCAAVQTYLQSGNVVCDAPRAAPEKLAQAVAETLRRDLGVSAAVLVLPARRWAQVVAGNPFLQERGLDATKLHVTFPLQPPTAAALAKLETLPKGPDLIVASGGVLYLHCPEGYGRSKLSNVPLERALQVEATTRNWNTVTALQRLLEA